MSSRRVALLFGIGSFEDSSWAALPYVTGDIEGRGGLSSTLQLDLGTLCFSDVHSQLEEVSRLQMMQALYNLGKNYEPEADSLVLVYFSGHGYIDNTLGEQLFLVAHDTTETQPGISLYELAEPLKRLPCPVIVILDCCFSGSAATMSWPAFSENVTIIASSMEDEGSHADPGHNQSRFTKTLIAGLKGEASNNEGIVSVASLISYLEKSMAGQGQSPTFKYGEPSHAGITLSKPLRYKPIPVSRSNINSDLLEYAKAFITTHGPDGNSPSHDSLTNHAERLVVGQNGKSFERTGDRQIASGLLHEWLGVGNTAVFLLTGDTGLGKTTVLTQFSVELCQSFVEGESEQCPIFIDLRMYLDVRFDKPATLARRTDEEERDRRFRSFFVDWLQSECSLPLFWSDIVQLAKSDKLVFICDGLDEMLLDGRETTVHLCLDQLHRLMSGRAHLVVSCRTHFFRTDSHLIRSFAKVFGGHSVEFADLKQLSEHEVDTYMDSQLGVNERQRWMDLRKQSHAQLRAICSRPFLLSIIAGHLRRSEQVLVVDVFEQLLAAWLERDNWRFSQFLMDFREAVERDVPSIKELVDLEKTDTVKWANELIILFLEAFASDLSLADDNGVSASKIPDLIKERFPSLPDIFIDFFETVLRTCSLLSRSSDGTYGFINLSVQAFLQSRFIVRELRWNRYYWDKSAERQMVGIRPVPMSLGRGKLTPTVLFFCSHLVNLRDYDRLKELISDDEYARRIERCPNTLYYLAGNAASVLWASGQLRNKKNPLPLVLTDKNLSGAQLTSYNFAGSDLRRTILEDADLSQARFDRAELDGIRLISVNLHGATFQGAHINGNAVVQLRPDCDLKSLKDYPPEFENALRQSEKRKGASRFYTRSEVSGLTKCVRIPGGRYHQGSTERHSEPHEKPAHEVIVSPFMLELHPVTNRQFREFVRANPEWGKAAVIDRLKNVYYLKLWDNDEPPADLYDQPVVYVSWYAAEAYATWAGRRLPSEAEWEFAFRNGMHDGALQFPWGDDESLPSYLEEIYAQPGLRSVGTTEPNSYGIYDMVGLVNEWVADWFKDDFYELCYRNSSSGNNVRNPSGPDFGREKVIRGASFLEDPYKGYGKFRCAHRAYLVPQNTNQDGGFRCAMSDCLK